MSQRSMTYLDACAGIGGFRLALDLLGVPVTWHGFSEVDKDAIAIYKAHWPEAVDLGDLARWGEWGIAPGWLDLFSCGFPCPPFSVAGKRLGGDDPRNLWPVVAGAIRGLRPRHVMLENVPGILAGDGEQPAYFGRVLGDLAEAGYDAEWEVLSAREVGASHRRERVFVVAHDNGCGSAEQEGEYQTLGRNEQPDGLRRDVAHDDSAKPQCAQRTRPRPGDPESGRSHCQLARCREYLAVPRRGGRRADDEGQRETGRGRVAEAGGLVENAYDERSSPSGNAHERLPKPDTTLASSEVVGDAGSVGLTISPPIEKMEGERLTERRMALFPPGPGDAEGWRRVLARWPELAPAVDGRLNPRFVEWLMGFPIGWCDGMKRNAALKALGNAVVSQCVAAAVRRIRP